MAHVHTFGHQCKNSEGIIHIGATSCYVGDNAEQIVMYEALQLIHKKVVNVIKRLRDFADKYKELPTLGYTHFQAAQPVTVGKRATLWLNEFLMDLKDIEYILEGYEIRGVKGTTGTCASFMELFNNDYDKVLQLGEKVVEKLGFKRSIPVSGQTYSRKIDSRICNVLSGIAASAYKMAQDIRLLQHLKEIEEPFEKSQIGSSAMAYKRNPMRSERVCSLSRLVMANTLNPMMTSSTQWFERTLDDSANKRISTAESFLTIDGVLDLCLNILDGLVVYPKIIEKHIREELPFMATENILMRETKNGGNRQELHEKIRVHSMKAGKMVKVEGKENDLLDRISNDPSFSLNRQELDSLLDPKLYIGASVYQVDDFLKNEIDPILEKYKEYIVVSNEIAV